MALFTIQNEFRYEIVRKIFEGGMGIVYEAEQLGAREFVKRIAIKVIRQDYASPTSGPTNETLGRFIRELFGQAIPPPATQVNRGSTKRIKTVSSSAAKS